MNPIFLNKVKRVLTRKLDAFLGGCFFDLEEVLKSMASRPYELHLELTNACNANCIFCPYQFQKRTKEIMSDEVFFKAVDDFVANQGGSVGLTPIVGDALLDPKFMERVRYLRSIPAIDRIFLTTNAIFIDRYGSKEILTSGLTSINISTASFNRDNYEKIYRSSAYDRMKKNVTQLVMDNYEMGSPVNICIGLRTDRQLSKVTEDSDFQPIRQFVSDIDFTWSFTSASGRISQHQLPKSMKLHTSPKKREPCVNLFHGPIVLSNGEVLACGCVAAMDAAPDLLIGSILKENLIEIYTSNLMHQLRNQFNSDGLPLNNTCSKCDMYRNLEFYRTSEGRKRATMNRKRLSGNVVSRQEKATNIFNGG
jgi:MoaA/NifB/PqqE/SkfB family radical SAM enzyme